MQTQITDGLRPLEQRMYTEYRYRKLFRVARHEDYLDEPGEVIQWMTRIDALVRAEESKQAKEAANKKG